MERFRHEIFRTKIFLVHHSAFEEIMDVSLYTEFSFKAARDGTQRSNLRSVVLSVKSMRLKLQRNNVISADGACVKAQALPFKMSLVKQRHN